MITRIEGRCSYEDCDRTATHIACGRSDHDADVGRHPVPACYCEEHANKVTHEGWPEYTDKCPNCGCIFGVN